MTISSLTQQASIALDAEITNILIVELGISEDVVTGSKLISDAVLDSFDRIRLVSFLDEKYSLDIPWDFVTPTNFDTVPCIVRMIQSLQ